MENKIKNSKAPLPRWFKSLSEAAVALNIPLRTIEKWRAERRIAKTPRGWPRVSIERLNAVRRPQKSPRDAM